MLESVILAQQKQDGILSKQTLRLICSLFIITCWNLKLKQASPSSTPPCRLPSKPKPNAEEYCDCIALGSGKQLEGHKGANVKVDGHNNHDVNADSLPSKDEPQKKNEIEKPKESKPPFLEILNVTLFFPVKICQGQT